MLLRVLLAATPAIAAAVFAAAPALAASPDQIVVFGDSLVDAGNIFLATGGFAPSNVYNNPSQGYFPGRFTNGPDYTDLLSARLYGSYSVPYLAGGNNYAFGGATYVDNGGPVPDLAEQVGLYTAGHTVDPNALYIINLGGNDVFAIDDGTVPAALVPAYEAALTNVLATTLTGLHDAGATKILVTGIPNTDAVGFALEAQVEATLNAVQPTLTGTTLYRFSYQRFFEELAADPTRFDVPPITHLPTDGCFSHLSPPATMDCSGYFSVDGTHPIAPIQAAIFRAVAHEIGVGAVPEPATWGLMVAGFGLIGSAVRRRRTVAAA
jgi:phospholipase/lecithinase/hemolysin